MERPWMKLHTRDWLDNKELRRCSPIARAILADLMCLAHEGVPYGHLSDKVGPLSNEYMAARCVVPLRTFHKAIVELKSNDRIAQESDLFIPRMVADEDLRVRRAAGGKESIGHPNTHPPKNTEGYPSFENDSRERAPTDSGSGNGSGVCGSSEKTTKTEVSPSQTALIVTNSTIQSVFQELKGIYQQAGKPISEKHENIAFQLLMNIPEDRLPRVPNYVKWALVSGTWSDAAHTKSLLNLLRDGDWDVDIVARTLPNVLDNRVKKSQDEARRQFMEEQ